MAKRKNGNKKKPHWLTEPKNRPQIFVLALILLGGGFFAYQSYAKWQDKIYNLLSKKQFINTFYRKGVAKALGHSKTLMVAQS